MNMDGGELYWSIGWIVPCFWCFLPVVALDWETQQQELAPKQEEKEESEPSATKPSGKGRGVGRWRKVAGKFRAPTCPTFVVPLVNPYVLLGVTGDEEGDCDNFDGEGAEEAARFGKAPVTAVPRPVREAARRPQRAKKRAAVPAGTREVGALRRHLRHIISQVDCLAGAIASLKGEQEAIGQNDPENRQQEWDRSEATSVDLHEHKERPEVGTEELSIAQLQSTPDEIVENAATLDPKKEHVYDVGPREVEGTGSPHVRDSRKVPWADLQGEADDPLVAEALEGAKQPLQQQQPQPQHPLGIGAAASAGAPDADGADSLQQYLQQLGEL